MASASGPIKVLHFGLGPIGAGVVKQVAERKGFKIVGAVDIDPAKVGRDLGEVARLDRTLRVKVSDNARKTIKSAKPDVAVLCTSSSMKKVMEQMEGILKLKVPIVSTTEELAYPTKTNMRYAREIHQMAKKAKVAVLGTGVNPGFVMDARRTDSGRADSPAAVSTEDRGRPDPRAVPAQGRRWEREARGAGGVGLDDCRGARLEGRPDHR